MQEYVSLHTHSTYSLLDGGTSLDALAKRVAAESQPALALTDHGVMHGAWLFQKACKKVGIKPIIGMEAYVAAGSRHERKASKDERSYHHLVLLARDLQGYKNLSILSSRGWTEGFYQKARIDRELLAAYGEGIIVTSACMAGEIARHLEADRWDAARATATWYAENFRDRFYLEVQGHDSPGQSEHNAKIFRLAEEMGLPVVATNDSHFLAPQDHAAHDVLICIGMGKDLHDANRLHYDKGLYFKSGDEMAERFPTRPDVLANTCKIADEVNVEWKKQYHVPSFPIPPAAASEAAFMRSLVMDGLARRYDARYGTPGAPTREEVQARAEFELSVIEKQGYASYFLIVWDFIKYARDHGISVGPGRGSAAGSIVAYALEITDVCPLMFNLLFERFLNPERVTMPDIDIDFCFRRRGEVIEYVRQKYGERAVSQIVTFSTLKARAAIKDVGRVLGFTPGETQEVANLVPENIGVTIAEAEAAMPELRSIAESRGPRFGELISYAKKLEGLARGTGVHAAGVVIAPGPVEDYVPVCTVASKAAGSGGQERVLVTQYDMNCLEEAGMLKMDFLGLTTLTVLEDAVAAIERRHGVRINLRTLPLDDPAVFAMLSRGETEGVFQFESPLATETLRSMRCDRFDDLVAANALLRPGPLDAGMHKVYIRRKRGEEEVTYALPELEPILKPTYGVITYQEQVMRLAQVIGGISLAEADVLRKAVGKKDPVLIKAEVGKFVEKAVGRGFDRTIIETIADQIVTFGRYGFNQSHAVAYSVVSYHTAYLKAHYPAEFWAALLTSVSDEMAKVITYSSCAKDSGIAILPPDVNESGLPFTAVGPLDRPSIRFGMVAVKDVGAGAVQAIIAGRADGPYTSLYDLCARTAGGAVTAKVVECLVQAGGCDSLGGHRAQQFASVAGFMSAGAASAKARQAGQSNLFDAFGADDATETLEPRLVEVAPWTDEERLARERERTGCFISGHPLERLRDLADAMSDGPISGLGAYRPDRFSIAGVLTNAVMKFSKKDGKRRCELTLEDFTGRTTLLAFSDTVDALESAALLVPLRCLLVTGGYSKRDALADAPTFMIDSAVALSSLQTSPALGIQIRLRLGAPVAPDVFAKVRALLDTYPGASQVQVAYEDEAGVVTKFSVRSGTVAATTELLTALRGLLGKDQVRLIRLRAA